MKGIMRILKRLAVVEGTFLHFSICPTTLRAPASHKMAFRTSRGNSSSSQAKNASHKREHISNIQRRGRL